MRGELDLDGFWSPRLPPSRQSTRWLNVLKRLVTYRLIDPGSEWRLHRHWYCHSALGDLLGEDEGVAQSDTLYRCLDKLLAHKKPFFSYLRGRWQDLFGVRFEVLLYDLTSTHFESDPPSTSRSASATLRTRIPRQGCNTSRSLSPRAEPFLRRILWLAES